MTHTYRTLKRVRQWMLASLIAVLATAAAPAGANTYPTKPVTLVVPYSAGGIADILSRRLADSLTKELGQTVVIENRPGGNTAVGAVNVSNAKPDGYTLLLATAATMVLNPYLNTKLSYDPKDFTAVANLAITPLVFVVGEKSPLDSYGAMIAAAKKDPGKLNYGSTGLGSTTHLAIEVLESEGKVSMNHIPYNGSMPSLNGVVSGDVDLSLDSVASALPLIRGGKLRPLAVTTKDRVGVIPDVPTVAESGLPKFNVSTWYGVAAPRGTPPEVVDRLNQAILKVSAEPAFRRPFEALGLVMAPPLKPAQYAAFIEDERKMWGPVIESNNIRVQ